MRHIVPTGISIGYRRGDELLLVSDDYLNHLLPPRRETLFNMLWAGCAGIAVACAVTLPIALAFFLWWNFVALLVSVPLSVWGYKRWRHLRDARLNWLRSVEANPIQERVI